MYLKPTFAMRCFSLILFVTVTLLLHLPSFGQENVLLQYSNTRMVSKQDSAAIIELIRKSQDFEYKNIDSAVALVDEALRRSQQLKFNYGIGNAYIAYSVYASTQGNYRKCDSLLKKAFPYCLRSAMPPSSPRLLALWYGSASIQAAYGGDYHKSVNLAFAGLNLINQRPDDSTLVLPLMRAYNSIGSLLLHLNESAQSFYYLDKGIALATARNEKHVLAQLYVNYGNASLSIKQWSKAIVYFQKAIALCKEGGYILEQQIAYISMGGMYRNLNQHDTAIACIKLAINLTDKTNPYMAKITPYLILGEIYFNKKNYRQSIQYGEAALSLSERLNTPQNTAVAHGLLAVAYGSVNQWQKAYNHQTAYNRLYDSVRGASTIENINKLEIKSRVAEKDKELSRQQLSLAQKESALREKNFWIAGALAGALLLAALLFTARRGYRNKQQLQESNKEIDRLKATMEGAEQERKRIAVELHDGIVSQLWGLKLNLTTTINRQQEALSVEAADFQDSLDYLDDAMNDLRHTAHNLSPEMALQSGLTQALSDFCRKRDKQVACDVVFQAYGQEQPTNKQAALSIYRAVQELVQNAMKHAAAATVLVQLNYEEDITGITVQDDGRGFDITKCDPGSGMGLRNITERVHLLRGSIDIQSNEKGTSIYMEFKNKDIAPA